jgi:hypothetical protein
MSSHNKNSNKKPRHENWDTIPSNISNESEKNTLDDWIATIKNWHALTLEEKWQAYHIVPMALHYKFITRDDTRLVPTYHVPTDIFDRTNRATASTVRFLDAIMLQMKIQEQNDNDDDDVSDDSEDSDTGDWVHQDVIRKTKTTDEEYEAIKARYKTFIDALPYCVPLDFGFMVEKNQDNKFCSCPCQVNRYQFFCQMFGINIHIENNCGITKFYTPHSLYNHLNGMIVKNNYSVLQVLHKLTLHYIESKYRDKKTKLWYNDVLPRKVGHLY